METVIRPTSKNPDAPSIPGENWESRQHCGLVLSCEFHVQAFSACSHTGAVVALALRQLFPTCRIKAKLGAIAMPRGVFAALLATAEPGLCDIHLIHAEDDHLVIGIPARSTSTLSRVGSPAQAESARWMGASKHQYWHWLHCPLPTGHCKLTDLKLSHPDIIP